MRSNLFDIVDVATIGVNISSWNDFLSIRFTCVLWEKRIEIENEIRKMNTATEYNIENCEMKMKEYEIYMGKVHLLERERGS